MRRIFIFALFALTMAGGVAGADSYRHRDSGTRYQRGGVSVQRSYPRHTYRQTYRHNYRQTYRPAYHSRVVIQPRVHVVRRPIYIQRPVIQYRYRNYYQRPAIIVENQQPMSGYIWVPGQWQWNGYEWIWQSGHYEPDPAYDNYNYNYDNGSYYNNGTSYDGSYYNNGY
jgi:hypothetical protein